MRYSVLKQFSNSEKLELACKLLNFFSPTKNGEIVKALGYRLNELQLHPLTFLDFLKYTKLQGKDYFPLQQRIKEVVGALCRAHLLTSRGGHDFLEVFSFEKEFTNREKMGYLWLGKAFGFAYIADLIKRDVVLIVGFSKEGDENVGTGILIGEKIILTCAHVIDDMNISYVEIRGEKVTIDYAKSHEKVDVGIIFLEDAIERNCDDLWFRQSTLLEPILISGYPKIPRSLAPYLTFHSGEISGSLPATMDKFSLDLFTAIAQPGNSGGPVIGIDGCILGIVTRSLERQQETSDAMSTLPFFASVPTIEIVQCIEELTGGSFIPLVETYD